MALLDVANSVATQSGHPSSGDLACDILFSARVGQSPLGDHDGELLPICVDLDGTLVRTDTLVEGVLAMLSNPASWRHLPELLTPNKAVFKQTVAQHAALQVELLPYNAELISWLEDCRAAGHPILLATAADAGVAHAVARHLALFDEVVCSDQQRNLKGPAKAAALVDRFGSKRFHYVGNDSSDLAVWREAAKIVAVDVSDSLLYRAAELGPLSKTLGRSQSDLSAVVRAVRPHQWSKNLLVFVPMLAAQAVAEPLSWLVAILLFVSFSAAASSIYVVNDLLDLASDRRHPRKRNRPLASGALSIPKGVAISALLAVCGLGLAAWTGALLVVVIYAALSFSYSMALKRFPLVDVFVLAALYTLRILAGGVATGHTASLWLIAFSGFLFLSLALVKRTEELRRIERNPTIVGNDRRGYQAGDRELLQMLGCASGFSASVVLALFVGSATASANYRAPEVLWAVVPLILFWECRLWLATTRGYMHDDPIVYASRDWVSWLVGGCIVVIAGIASTGIIHFA
jgi:4-hydroxybenzoate polyprenyltransferase/phosphoglycolate phosphatase-like HAD superfamily hydrolase